MSAGQSRSITRRGTSLVSATLIVAYVLLNIATWALFVSLLEPERFERPPTPDTSIQEKRAEYEAAVEELSRVIYAAYPDVLVITDKNRDQLAPLLQQHPDVRSIHAHCQLTPEELTLVCAMPKLEQLHARQVEREELLMFHRCKLLRCVVINLPSWTNDDLTALLKACPNLQYLWVSSGTVDEELQERLISIGRDLRFRSSEFEATVIAGEISLVRIFPGLEG